jgi:tetratricopeptide (TPR) repeat protein
MNTVFKKILSLGLVVFIVGSVEIFSASFVHADTEVKSISVKAKSRVRRTPALRPVVYTKLEEVQKLADKKNYTAAFEKLTLLQKMQRNSYEQAMTFSMQAYVHFNKENWAEAAKSYESLLNIKNIPISLEETTLFSLAKLYFIQEQYKPALETLNTWFELTEKPNSQAYVMRAQMHYEMKNYLSALPDIKRAMSIAHEQGLKKPENWLLLERAIYYQNKDFKAMERCLKDLVALYPKKSYWLQLAAIYNELNKPLKELAIMEMMYDQGVLQSELELVNLAQALLANNSPYKSASIILTGIKDKKIEENAKNLRLLGDSLMLAKEYSESINVLERAANLSQQSKDYFKVAQLAVDRQLWDKAENYLEKAIALGGLSQPQDALVLKGTVLFNRENLSAARTEFEKAKTYSSTQKVAEQWLGYIDAEMQRRAYMSGIE